MITLRQVWQRITSTRYTPALEAHAHMECALREEVTRQRAEIDRLRAENRALLNSILGIAGVPPIYVTEEELASCASGRASPTDQCVGSAPPETLPSESHSESARADDESIFRPPPPAKAAAGNDSLGTPVSNKQGSPRNDSPHPASSAQSNTAQTNNAGKIPALHKMRPVATPLRRRSWHQINRMLEIESTRKQVTSD